LDEQHRGAIAWNRSAELVTPSTKLACVTVCCFPMRNDGSALLFWTPEINGSLDLNRMDGNCGAVSSKFEAELRDKAAGMHMDPSSSA